MPIAVTRFEAETTKEALEKKRRQLIQLIHVGRRALAMDDDTWRAYLQRAFCRQSSADLSVPQLKTAVNHLRAVGFSPTDRGGRARPAHEWSFVDRAVPSRATKLRKILMLMQATGVERGSQVRYVEGIAKQMAGLNADGSRREAIATPLPMCDEDQLQRIVAALSIHVKRLAARQEG